MFHYYVISVETSVWVTDVCRRNRWMSWTRLQRETRNWRRGSASCWAVVR